MDIEKLKRENKILKDALCREQDQMSLARLHLKNAQDRIIRLEKAGDELLEWLNIDGVSLSNQRLLANQWYRAKGVKK